MQIAFKGIGVNISPIFGSNAHEEVMAQIGSIDFLEIDPEAFSLDDPAFVEILRKYKEHFGLTLHSTSLSLCGDQPVDMKLVSTVGAFLSATDAPFYSDHLSFMQAQDVLLDLYMCPAFTEEMLAWTERRVDEVMRATASPFIMENVGALFQLRAACYTEPEFIRRLLDKTNAGLMLNLDSVAISAATFSRDPVEYLLEFPLDRVVTISLVPESCMNPIMRNRFGCNLDSVLWKLLDVALAHSPASLVTLQRRRCNSLDSLANELSAIRGTYSAHRKLRPCL